MARPKFKAGNRVLREAADTHFHVTPTTFDATDRESVLSALKAIEKANPNGGRIVMIVEAGNRDQIRGSGIMTAWATCVVDLRHGKFKIIQSNGAMVS